MNATFEQKVARLFDLKLARYEQTGHMNPRLAAKGMTQSALKWILQQPTYADQLIDEEIEDAEKAAAQRAS